MADPLTARSPRRRRARGPRRPRQRVHTDLATAATASARQFVVVSLVTLLMTLVVPDTEGPWVLPVVALAGLTSLGWAALMHRGRGRLRAAAVVAAPFVAVGEITLVALSSHDATATGQVMFCLEAVLAAAYLPEGVAWSATGLALVADAVVAASGRTTSGAVSDVVFVGMTMVLGTALPLQGRRRQAELVERLHRLATRDALTGVASRGAVDDALAAAMTGPVAPGDQGVALLLVDLDRFKAVNDVHGHPAGDAALVHLARVLDAVVAHTAPGGLVGRLGGDEFTVLLPGRSRRAADAVARDVVDDLAGTPLVLADGTRLALSASVGVAHAEVRDPHAVEALYASADAALYRHKAAGREDAAPGALPPAGARPDDRRGSRPLTRPRDPAPS